MILNKKTSYGMWNEEMYVWYLSTLSVWPQFVLTTNKSKGGDCWVFEYWLRCC